jgi:DNA-binding XRE family transcriptional regulator
MAVTNGESDDVLAVTHRRSAGAGEPAPGEWLGRPFGVAVRARRLELGLTQERLAAQAGMSQGALSRLEHGRGVPTLPLLERLAAALSSNLLIALSPHGAIQVVFRAPPR